MDSLFSENFEEFEEELADELATIEIVVGMDGETADRHRELLESVAGEVPELEEDESLELMMGVALTQVDQVVEQMEGIVALIGDADVGVLSYSIPDGIEEKFDRIAASIREVRRQLGGSWYERFACELDGGSE